jgi:hypothetical protein
MPDVWCDLVRERSSQIVLNDDDLEVSELAFQKMSEILLEANELQQLNSLLTKAMESQRVGVRLNVAKNLYPLRNHSDLSSYLFVIDILFKDDDVNVRRYAVINAGLVQSDDMLSHLRRAALKDHSKSIRKSAVSTLTSQEWSGYPGVPTILTEALNDSALDIRLQAASRLANTEWKPKNTEQIMYKIVTGDWTDMEHFGAEAAKYICACGRIPREAENVLIKIGQPSIPFLLNSICYVSSVRVLSRLAGKSELEKLKTILATEFWLEKAIKRIENSEK